MNEKNAQADPLSTRKSRDLHERARRVLANGVSSGIRKWCDPLLYFDRAEGPHFFDVDGNAYVDYTLGWGPLVAGGNHPKINEALASDLVRSYTFGAQHRLEIELASKMVDVLPGVEQVIFANSGTEIVQAAIRIARAKTGRDKIVKFEGHYHGWMNNILVSFHPQERDLGTATPACGGQPEKEYEDTIVLPWNDLKAVEKAFAANPGQIACVATEPILANSGCCMPDEGYLQGLIDLCRKNDAVSIFDEIITGFRIALGGAREHFGLEPDISTYAKAMAGGFTISAAGGRAEMFDVLRDGRTMHAGTYNGSMHNVAAAIATIGILSEPGVFERMHAHGRAIREHVEQEAAKRNLQLVTTGLGSVFSVHFGLTRPPRDYADTLSIHTDSYAAFRAAMLKRGVHLLPDGRWYVGATHSDAELAKTREAIEGSLDEI